MTAIDLISLPLKNMSFYVDSIKKIDTNPKIIESKIGEICKSPLFLKFSQVLLEEIDLLPID